MQHEPLDEFNIVSKSELLRGTTKINNIQKKALAISDVSDRYSSNQSFLFNFQPVCCTPVTGNCIANRVCQLPD